MNKNSINLILGEMGGVGKSLFTKVFLEFYINNKGSSYHLFDLDNSKFDVGMIYDRDNYKNFNSTANNQNQEGEGDRGDNQQGNPGGEVIGGKKDLIEDTDRKKIYFTEDKKRKNSVDKIIDLAIKEQKDIIINTPANIQRMLVTWFTESSLLDLLKDKKIGCNFWFVSNGSSDSFASLEELLGNFKNQKVKIILVENLHFLDEELWDRIIDENLPSLQQMLIDFKANYYLFPELDYQAKFILEQKKVTFNEMIADDSSYGTILDRQRIRTFLNLNYEKLKETFKVLK